MSFEQAMGMIAAVYSTPLPAVFDMGLSSIATYVGFMGSVIQNTNPMASKPEEPMSPDQVRSLLG